MTHKQWAWSRTRAVAAYLWPSLAVVAMVLVSYFFFGSRSSAQARQRKSAGNAKSASSRFENTRAESGFEEEGPDLIRQRMEWFYKQRAFPLGHIPAGARMKAFEHMQRMMENEGKLVRQPSGGFTAAVANIIVGPTWSPIGPAPTSGGFFSPVTGRVTTIAVDPSVATGQTVLIGGAQGGIWRSTDGGATWIAVGDANPSLAMGSIAFAPSAPATVYAGTGEQASTGFDVYYGAGILKSTDGGVTWTPTCPSGAVGCNNPFAGPFSNGFFPGGGARISYLSVNPTNSNLVLAGVQVFTGTNAAGVYCSSDGGLNWTNILAGQMATFVGFANSMTAFVALGRPFGSASGGGQLNANGIYKSTTADGGMSKVCSAITFTNLTTLANSGLPTTNVGRIDMGIFDANTVYASISDSSTQSNTNQGIWKTVNGGTMWTKTAAPDICRQQCWYDNVVKVDPSNSAIVYFGGSSFGGAANPSWIQRSTDGGASWNTVVPALQGPGLPHVDNHAITLFKAGSGKVIGYLGNDGGVWRTDDAEAANVTWTNINNFPLQLTQFYPSLSIHPSNPNIAFAGAQDNASQNLTDPVARTWVDNQTCGDGGWTVIDPVTPSNVYVACISADINKSVNNGAPGSFVAASRGIATSDQVNFIAPFIIDPANPNRLYFGTTRVWQTTDNAGSWNFISNNLSGAGQANVITALGVGGSTGSVVYAGTGDANVSVATNVAAGSATFNPVSGLGTALPPRSVTQIVTDPADNTGKTAYVLFSGFAGVYPATGLGGDHLGHIFKTIDAGATWTDMSCTNAGACENPVLNVDLPNIPVNDLVIDPDVSGTLFAATDLGVFQGACTAVSCTWTSFNNASLPNVAVFSLRLHRPSRTMIAATHGRGAWSIVLTNSPQTFNISDISPSSIAQGSAQFTLTVDGHGFTANSKIVFKLNGTTTTITPTSQTATQLQGVIPAAAITTGGNAQVTVIDGLNTTNALTFVVTGGGDFSLAFTGSTNMTVSAGQTATYPLTIAALNGFAGTVSLSCSLPATATTCSTTPASVTQAGNFTVTVTTTSRALLPPSLLRRLPRLWPLGAPLLFLAALLFGIIFFAKRTRRQRTFAGATLALFAVFLVMEAVGCGGGGAPPPPPPHGTPAGTYTVTVTGTSGSTTHTATLTLNVL